MLAAVDEPEVALDEDSLLVVLEVVLAVLDDWLDDEPRLSVL